MKGNHRSTGGSRETRTSSTVTYSRTRFSPVLTSSFDDTEKLESFEISQVTSGIGKVLEAQLQLPKTDYTYARSGSYSPRHLHDKYTTPNMSRRGLHKFVTPPVSLLQDSDSESSVAVESQSSHQRVVTRPGMILRSGIRLRKKELLLAEQEEEARLRSSSGLLTNSAQAVEATPSGVLGLRQRTTAHPAHESKHTTTTVTTTRKYLVAEDSDDQNEDYIDSGVAEYSKSSQARSGAWHSSETIEEEEEERRLRRKQTQSEHESWLSDAHQKEDGVRLSYLYGMDQTDVSDTEDIDMETSYSKGGLATRRGILSSFFFFMTTVVTTTTEYTYYAAKTVTTPFWTYLLGPVYHRGARMVSWMDEKVCTVISYFVLIDTWVLSRFTRNCCCLCLPLLFLLPLLCGGGYYLHKTNWRIATFDQVITYTSHLFRRVEYILPAEGEGGERRWLTRSEIEDLVQGMLSPQLESLQFSVMNIAKEGSSHQAVLQSSQDGTKQRLDSVEQQMAAFIGKTKEETVNILNLYNEMKPKVMNQDWMTRSEIEELVKSMLSLQMESLRLNLLSVAKEGSTDQGAHVRLDAMEKQLAELLNTAKNQNIHQEVQQIFLQLQKDEKRDWLTQSEVEVLVQGLLTSETESLRLSLLNSFKDGSIEQGDLKAIVEDARLRLKTVEEQMAALRDKTQTPDLSDQVQRILLQLQKEEKQDWLTQSEIEDLVKGLLSPQLDSLRLSLLAIIKDGRNASQDALKVSQDDARQRLDIVEKQLAELHVKTQDAGLRLDALETQLAALVAKGMLTEADLANLKQQLMDTIYAVRDSMEEKLGTEQAKERKSWEAKLASMEVTISDLRARVISSETSSRGNVATMSEKCCQDEAALLGIIRGEVGRMLAERDQGAAGVVGQVSSDDVRGIIDAALLKYSADKIGLPDYALESTGGSVVNIRCSKTYSRRAATVKVWGIPLYYTVNGPRTVIQPEVLPGNCWPFEGHEGSVVIQLAVPIKPTMFTLEHIGKTQSIFGDNKSAPKDFLVLGLSSESDTEGVILGEYHYDGDGTPMQHFDVQIEDSGIFLFVELRVTSNHGNEEYTCLYRFRVHGVPQEHN
ncbi:uncharacterized protein LOC143292413 isoform X2 [Babylonia areolata]|uniref:uncharacterized protein LOC143292413 isoform X2 n=1 Tax=Babylonia areolata TaxID=304850 RepID=UPI003FD083DC